MSIRPFEGVCEGRADDGVRIKGQTFDMGGTGVNINRLAWIGARRRFAVELQLKDAIALA